MQSSSIKQRFLAPRHQRKKQDNMQDNMQDNIQDNIDKYFKSFCKKIGVIHYSTKGKYKTIDSLWKPIYQEMQTDGIQLNTFDETISYLLQKLDTIPFSKKFVYEYIIRELHNYSNMSKEFASNYKDYIKRLKCYAKGRKCANMEELKKELTYYLGKYVVEVEYENIDNNNDYKKQDWLIISRYICDFLEEDEEFQETTELFN